MITDLSVQMNSAGIYALAGLLWGISADILFCLRRGGAAGVLMDLLFMCLGGGALFLLTVSIVQDNPRGYLLFLFFGTALLWHCTGGRVLRRCLRLLGTALMRVVKTVRHIGGLFLAPVQKNGDKKNGKRRKNTSLFWKNGLK